MLVVFAFLFVSKLKANKTELHPKVRKTCFYLFLLPQIFRNLDKYLLSIKEQKSAVRA